MHDEHPLTLIKLNHPEEKRPHVVHTKEIDFPDSLIFNTVRCREASTVLGDSVGILGRGICVQTDDETPR